MSDENVGGLVDAERLAQLIAHRACHAAEHDPQNGRIHGFCMVCGVPWPCEYAGKPPALSAHGENASVQTPVVDEAMVERAMDAFASVRVDPNSDTLDHDLMRAALTAALTGATP